MKCNRTVCQNEEQGYVHRDTGDKYCSECARRINYENNRDLIVPTLTLRLKIEGDRNRLVALRSETRDGKLYDWEYELGNVVVDDSKFLQGGPVQPKTPSEDTTVLAVSIRLGTPLAILAHDEKKAHDESHCPYCGEPNH